MVTGVMWQMGAWVEARWARSAGGRGAGARRRYGAGRLGLDRRPVRPRLGSGTVRGGGAGDACFRGPRRGATITGQLDRRRTRRVTLPSRRVASSPRRGRPRTMRSASKASASAQYRLGDPVDDRGPDVPAGRHPRHAQLEDGRFGDVGGLVAAFPAVPDGAGELPLAQVQHLDLGQSLGGHLPHQVKRGLALLGRVNRHQNPAEHRTSRGPCDGARRCVPLRASIIFPAVSDRNATAR